MYANVLLKDNQVGAAATCKSHQLPLFSSCVCSWFSDIVRISGFLIELFLRSWTTADLVDKHASFCAGGPVQHVPWLSPNASPLDVFRFSGHVLESLG